MQRGRGGWRGGRGGRGGPPGPAARDDDGNIVDSQPAGPPPLFPHVDLTAPNAIADRDRLLLLKLGDLSAASRRSPFFLELKDDKKEDLETTLDQVLSKPAEVAPSGQQGAGTAAAARASAAKKRSREPLTSVIKLLPEYIPDELFSNTDRKFAKFSDSYWKRSARKDDNSLDHLEALMKREERAAGAGGGGAGGEGEQDAPQEEEELRDTDDEEDMNEDDYYQGEHFDDDEGYDDGFDDGGGGDDGGYF